MVGAWAAAALAVALAPAQFVLSPEGNHLWAYDATSGARQLVARAMNGADPGTNAPNGLRRDINGQICVSPDQRHVITGEDTVSAGGDSHDPRIAGWGYFDISGARLGDIRITQTGKLAPAAGGGPGYNGDPDNYGCGFLDGDRLLTTAIGDTLPGQPATGQLFLWFGPFTDRVVRHCQIDGALATAGGIAVDGNDVYVTANRPDGAGNPSAVWRYQGRWPRSAAECTAAYLAANIRREQVIPSLPLLPVDLRAPTPSSVAISPRGTLVVASVFTGTVTEYAKDGTWQRDLYPLSPLTPPNGPLGETPYGVTFTADGTLWIADLGIVGAMPVGGQGSVLRLRFDASGAPQLPAEVVRANLTFPDGLGVYTPPSPAVAAAPTSSEGELPASGRTMPVAFAAALLVLWLLHRRHARKPAPD